MDQFIQWIIYYFGTLNSRNIEACFVSYFLYVDSSVPVIIIIIIMIIIINNFISRG